MTEKSDPSIESEIRNHAWAYFSLHAQQRMSVFQFFVTIEIALFGGVFFAVQSNLPGYRPFALIGLIITLLAFVFWKIDQRTRQLIKNAEQSLIDVENYLLKKASITSALPFSLDPQLVKGLKAVPLKSGRLTYSQSFGVLYLGCGILGLLVTGWLFFYLKP